MEGLQGLGSMWWSSVTPVRHQHAPDLALPRSTPPSPPHQVTIPGMPSAMIQTDTPAVPFGGWVCYHRTRTLQDTYEKHLSMYQATFSDAT